MPNDTVRLVINGKEFSGWTGATISMAIDQVADAFSLTAPFDPYDLDVRAAFRPCGYQACNLYIGDDLILSGRKDKSDPTDSTDGNTINIQGRSLPGQLIDNSIDGDIEFSGLTLATIARKLAKQQNVTVRADTDTPALEVARATYGQKIADFLNSLAAPRNIFLNSSYDGRLVISSADDLEKKEPVMNIIAGTPPYLGASASYDDEKRFRIYRIATQMAGFDDIIGESIDAAVTLPRLSMQAVEEADQDTGITATRVRAVAYASATGVNVTLAGWRRPDGKLFAERQAINLTAPTVMVYRQTRFIIAGVTFKLDTGGRTVDLRLIPPETYSGKLPKVEAWS